MSGGDDTLVFMTHPWYIQPASFALPTEWNLGQEIHEELTNDVWGLVLHGANDPEEYWDYLEDELTEEGVTEAAALSFFEQVIANRKAQQEELGQPHSALTQAFAKLTEIGVIGRESFTCCGTCGSSEIWDERDVSRQWRGYLYYHSQDADVIPESEQTYVGYGAFLDAFYSEQEWEALSDEEKEAKYDQTVRDLMINEAFPILKKHGIGVEWDGDLSRRILLTGVQSFRAV